MGAYSGHPAKRIRLLLLVLALPAVGCGGDSDDSGTTSSSSGTSTASGTQAASQKQATCWT